MRSINLTTGREAARILIAGAGPTGLMLALCLKQYGIAVDIVDAKSGPSADSKALAINPMSQLQFSMFFGDALLGKGAVKVNKMNISWQNSTRINRIDLSRLNSNFATMLVQTQFDTETELAQRARERGIDVQWNTRVTQVNENPHQVTVVLHDNTGTTCEKNYDYVIGCDGKRSVVRAAMDTVMEQKSYEMFLALADYELNTDLDDSSAHYIIYEDTFFVLVPLGEKKWRVVVKHNGTPDKKNGVELVTEPVKKYFGETMLTGEPFWFSQAPLYVSYAEKLSTQRLFIAGDAAHLFSPIGGTGMNSGFLDALNLGWKLAYEILGYSNGKLLTNSYNEERLPAIKENALATDRLTQLISRIAKTDKDIAMFLPTMKNRFLMRSVLPTNIAGTTVNYQNSSAIEKQDNISLGYLDNSFAELVSVHASHNQDKAPLIKLFYFVDQLATGDEIFATANGIPATTNKIPAIANEIPATANEIPAIANEIKVPPKSGLLPVAVNYHSDTSNIIYKKINTLSIPKAQWDLLASKHTLVAIRPDGVVAYKGNIADYNTMITNSFNYLTAA